MNKKATIAMFIITTLSQARSLPVIISVGVVGITAIICQCVLDCKDRQVGGERE
jgi:hypothetical protein